MNRGVLALAGVLLLALTPSASLAHDPRDDRPKRSPFTTGTSVPLVTSAPVDKESASDEPSRVTVASTRRAETARERDRDL